MAKTIEVRDVADETHRELRARAAAAGMSLSQYVLDELNRLAGRPAVSDVLRRAAQHPISISDAEIVAAVRSGRDRD